MAFFGLAGLLVIASALTFVSRGHGLTPGPKKCDVSGMRLANIQDLQRPESQAIFASPLLDGDQSNVRIIRLAQGSALPPHRHGGSDLMLYAAAGEGQLDVPEGPVPFHAGSLAFYRGSEELRVRNTGTTELTLLAFLAPKFAASA